MVLHVEHPLGVGGQRVAHRVVEAVGPRLAGGAGTEVDQAEVVHDVATADDEHVAIAQRGQRPTEIEVVLQRLHRVDRQLHDRHVGVGEHVGEHAPGAVVEAPAVVILPDPRRLDGLGDLTRQVGQAGRRVVEGEQLGREAVEVVDRARRGHRRHRGGVDEPVGRDAQDGARLGHGLTERPPGLGVAVVGQGVHGVAMTDEGGGHHVRGSYGVTDGLFSQAFTSVILIRGRRRSSDGRRGDHGWFTGIGFRAGHGVGRRRMGGGDRRAIGNGSRTGHPRRSRRRARRRPSGRADPDGRGARRAAAAGQQRQHPRPVPAAGAGRVPARRAARGVRGRT